MHLSRRSARLSAAILAMAVCVLLWALPAAAAGKVALVIGNNAYVHAPALANPVNDAKAIASVLRSIGFDVMEHHDVDQATGAKIMEQFAARTAQAEIGLVYFAGHGIQVSGDTFLVPIDVPLKNDRDMRKLIPASYFLQDAAQAKSAGVVILDACRDNPFVKRLSEATAQTRSLTVGRGLSRVDVHTVPKRGLIAYATQAGNVALDSMGGQNSPYATALIKHLGAPNKDIRLVFGSIRDEVISSTDRKQEPYTYGSLGGDPIYLNAGTSQDATQTTQQPKPPDITALIPAQQLQTSAPVMASYITWQSALKKGSWGLMTILSRRKEASVFPFIAGQLVAMRKSNPALSVNQAIQNLTTQRINFAGLNAQAASSIQSQLRDLNYFGGDVDGTVSTDTKSAFEAFAADQKGSTGTTAAALLALGEAAASRKAQSDLTGLWSGRYYYPRPINGITSVEFEMDLTFSQGRITGFVSEPNTFGNRTSAKLYATFDGTVSGNQVEWTKTYDGTGGVNHSVIYRGTIDRQARRIEGRWIIRSDWSGDFNIELN